MLITHAASQAMGAAVREMSQADALIVSVTRSAHMEDAGYILPLYGARALSQSIEPGAIRRPASPLRHLSDIFLGVCRYPTPIQDAGFELLDRLLEANSNRVQSDLGQKLLASRRMLERNIRGVLRESIAISQKAVQQASAAQEQGHATVEQEIARLDSLLLQFS